MVNHDEAARYAHWTVMTRAALDIVAEKIAEMDGKAEIHLTDGVPEMTSIRPRLFSRLGTDVLKSGA